MATATENAVGIDLGTTYSCVAVYQKGKVEVLSNDYSERTTPSYVAFTEHERLIGVEAKAMVGEKPENTVFDAKRMIGRKFNDPTITADKKNWPFKLVNNRGHPQIEVTYKNQPRTFSPEEISSMVLIHMKEMAEQYLGENVTNVVITCPAYFNDSQRKATKTAAQIAGLNVLRLTNEPIAAAIAFGYDRRGERAKNVLVYDLGGGTFDVCIVEIDDGVFDTIVVRGNTHLGGQDFDIRMVDYFIEEFKSKHGIDLSNDQQAKHKLRSKCELAKRSLSTKQEARVEVDSISNGIDFQSLITRARFEELCDDLFQATLIPVQEALQRANMTVANIDEVVLVGGSTKIPKLRQIIEDFFVGKKLNKTVNPDEAVAIGAAIQAASLGNSDKDEMLQKMQVNVVQPLTLGTDLKSGLVSEMIKRDTKLPAKMKKTFVTTYDDQTCMTIQVLEGERGTIAECNNLGIFTFDGIPAAPAGKKFVEVTFEVDLNGTLSVTAYEKSSNRRENWITNVGQMSQEEIEEKILVAELFKADDEKEKERLIARNNLEHNIFSIKNKLKSQFGSNLQQSDKDDAEAKIESTVLWLDANTSAPKERYEEKLQELTDLMKTLVLQQPSSSRN